MTEKFLARLQTITANRTSRAPADLTLIENAWNIVGIAIDRHLKEHALRRGEEQLRQSKAFLTEGQRISRTGSFSWRVTQNQFTWSEELYRIFDLPMGEPVTLALVGSRVHPEDMVSFRRHDLPCSRPQRAIFEYEHRLLMSDGSVKYVHVIAHGIIDNEGRLEYIGAIQDVTQRRLADERVRQSELDLRQMTETIPEMLWSATPDVAVDY